MTSKWSSEDLRPSIRHEFGHIAVAKAHGFKTVGVLLMDDEAGAESNLCLSLPTLEDVKTHLRRRIQVLYAGSLAQSLNSAGKVDTAVCCKFLKQSARDDFRKIGELSRMLVGIEHPGLSPEDFQKQLTSAEHELSLEAATLVESKVKLIWQLTNFFIGRWDEAGRSSDFRVSAEEIDRFIAEASKRGLV